MWACMECGRKLKTLRAAERAMSDGCPNCGGVDVDVDVKVEVRVAVGPVEVRQVEEGGAR